MDNIPAQIEGELKGNKRIINEELKNNYCGNQFRLRLFIKKYLKSSGL